MSDKNVTVREYTRPTLKFQLTDFRNEAAPDVAVDISSYEFDLIIKRDVTDPDANAYVWIESPMPDASGWTNGEIIFYLTAQETSLPPGDYVGELRWWSDGGTDNRPTDAQSVSFTVESSYDLL